MTWRERGGHAIHSDAWMRATNAATAWLDERRNR